VGNNSEAEPISIFQSVPEIGASLILCRYYLQNGCIGKWQLNCSPQNVYVHRWFGPIVYVGIEHKELLLMRQQSLRRGLFYIQVVKWNVPSELSTQKVRIHEKSGKLMIWRMFSRMPEASWFQDQLKDPNFMSGKVVRVFGEVNDS